MSAHITARLMTTGAQDVDEQDVLPSPSPFVVSPCILYLITDEQAQRILSEQRSHHEMTIELVTTRENINMTVHWSHEAVP